MITFNRALATIISLALIIGSAIGIVYLIGFLTGLTALTQLGDSIAQSFAELSTGEIQAILIATFIIAVILLVLEIRPFRARFVTVRDDNLGETRVFRSDIEQFLFQRVSKERNTYPERVDVIAHGRRFDVATGVEVSTDADRQAIRSQVEYDIRTNLASIGLEDDLERISTRVSRVRRVA